MNATIYTYGEIRVTLTTESPVSRYGFPVLRVEGHPATEGDAVDLGPADCVPACEGEAPGTAAALLLCIHEQSPLVGDVLDGARMFLSQWPDGPQL
jgi:hypothetical protein